MAFPFSNIHFAFAEAHPADDRGCVEGGEEIAGQDSRVYLIKFLLAFSKLHKSSKAHQASQPGNAPDDKSALW